MTGSLCVWQAFGLFVSFLSLRTCASKTIFSGRAWSLGRFGYVKRLGAESTRPGSSGVIKFWLSLLEDGDDDDASDGLTE